MHHSIRAPIAATCPSVGGPPLSEAFWRQFAQIESVVGIKVAPFNRYATQDVLRGVAASGRAREIALYTGNDDHIVLDLLSRYPYGGENLQFVGGLLGHWAVWTSRAVDLHSHLRQIAASGQSISPDWLLRNEEVTEMNAALFDVAHRFRGCIAGINEVLRQQGLMQTRLCLDPDEDLSPGQTEELDRVRAAFLPHELWCDVADQLLCRRRGLCCHDDAPSEDFAAYPANSVHYARGRSCWYRYWQCLPSARKGY